MKKIILAAAAAFVLTQAPATSFAAEEGPALMKPIWTFDGALGKFDRLQLQRGLQIYREICSSCHSLRPDRSRFRAAWPRPPHPALR